MKFSDRFNLKSQLSRLATAAFEDKGALRGFLEVVKVDPQGRDVEQLYLGENIITYQGRSNMAHLLAGDETVDRIVSELRCGDGGHDPGDPTTPLPPSAADTDLFGTLIITKAVTYDFPDGVNGMRVRFTADVAANEGNGTGNQAYSEVGLYDAFGAPTTNRMMTHMTFGLITKSDAFGLSFRYIIQV